MVPVPWKGKVGGLHSKAIPGKSMRPYLTNKVKQKGLGCGKSDRAPAYQTQIPEFKTPVKQNKQTK
jgi:hypothetical protein